MGQIHMESDGYFTLAHPQVCAVQHISDGSSPNLTYRNSFMKLNIISNSF